jgi:hypothetical protein
VLNSCSDVVLDNAGDKSHAMGKNENRMWLIAALSTATAICIITKFTTIYFAPKCPCVNGKSSAEEKDAKAEGQNEKEKSKYNKEADDEDDTYID